MRKIFALFITAIMTLSLSLTSAAANPIIQSAGQTASDNKILVAYFSHTGNTKELAGMIHSQVGGDLIQLVPVKAYPTDYDSTVDVASRELEQQARPRLRTTIANMDDYDTVYIGYPIWWSTIPMPVATFLESYDFSGKTVIPFCTHGGSGLASSVSDIRNLVPQATVRNGLAVGGGSVSSSEANVTAWLQRVRGTETQIRITAGDTVITAVLNDTQTARDIVETFPSTIKARNWDNKAYYGRVRGEVSDEGKQHNSLKAGDLVYWIEGNALMLYYYDERDTNISTPVITVGRITSDMNAFKNLEDRVPLEIEIRG